MYQALYRKYRPRSFSDVLGQTHIVTTLKNQVAQNRLSHAYLFVGTRGTGKTTCAKILARAVNCENPHDGEPCNQCSSCISLDNGSSTDVLELDAASNNGVENVRELREEAVFTPAQQKYRVYIIDEAHMLSISAFNALLKILEEPPGHVIFILATTEYHKVPATILSRCQRFSFKRLENRFICELLLSVAEREQFQIDIKAAELLARIADGSMRDALSLLDQCAGAGEVTEKIVREITGLASRGGAFNMALAICNRDAKRVFKLLDELYSEGVSIDALLDETAKILRDALMYSYAPEEERLLSGVASPTEIMEVAAAITHERIIYVVDILTKIRASFTRGSADRIVAEIAFASILNENLGNEAGLLPRLAELEKRVDSLISNGISVNVLQQPIENSEDLKEIDDEVPWDDNDNAEELEILEETAGFKAETVAAEEPEEALLNNVEWREIMKYIETNDSGAITSCLAGADAKIEGGILTIYIRDGGFSMEMLSDDWAKKQLQEAAETVLGRSVSINIEVREMNDEEMSRIDELLNFNIVKIKE